jgi:hypothetical protein
MVGTSAVRFSSTTLLLGALIAIPHPGFSQGANVVLTLPEGNAVGSVSVLHGDFRVYDNLPSFQVDAAGNIVVSDFLNARVQVFSPSGTATAVINPVGEPLPQLFPAQLLVLPGNRIVTRSVDQLSVYDYGGSRLATRGSVTGVLVDALPDGRFALDRTGGEGFSIFDSNLQLLQVAGQLPTEFGSVTTRASGQSSRTWTANFGDMCVAFLDTGASPQLPARRGSSVFVTARTGVWVFGSDGGLTLSGRLPDDQFQPLAPTTTPGLDREPGLIVEYFEPIVGYDGNVYSMVRRPDGLQIVKWDLTQLPPAPEIASSPNRPPVLDSVPAQTVAVGARLAFRLRATDPDGDLLTFSATNLPQGAQLNAESGLFVWTPTGNQAGTFQVTIRVQDSHCGADTKQMAITVQ